MPRAPDVAVGRLTAGLVRAAHPAPALSVTVFAGAYAAGAAGARLTLAVLVALVVLAGQLSVGWSNDWADAARDLAVGRADKPVVTGAVTPDVLRRAALLAAVACVVLSSTLGWRAGVLHVVLVASAWTYNLRLKATVWSWAPYAVSFGGLPSVATLAVPGGGPAPGWTTVGAALLGVGAHLANVLPDLEDDAGTGVRGLPHRIGRRGTALAAAGVLLTAVLVVVLGAPGAPPAVAWVALAGAATLTASAVLVALTRTTSRWPFTAALLVAGVAVLLLVAPG